MKCDRKNGVLEVLAESEPRVSQACGAKRYRHRSALRARARFYSTAQSFKLSSTSGTPCPLLDQAKFHDTQGEHDDGGCRFETISDERSLDLGDMSPSVAPPTPQEIQRKLSVHSVTRVKVYSEFLCLLCVGKPTYSSSPQTSQLDQYRAQSRIQIPY